MTIVITTKEPKANWDGKNVKRFDNIRRIDAGYSHFYIFSEWEIIEMNWNEIANVMITP